jgi:hypothetical protein
MRILLQQSLIQSFRVHLSERKGIRRINTLRELRLPGWPKTLGIVPMRIRPKPTRTNPAAFPYFWRCTASTGTRATCLRTRDGSSHPSYESAAWVAEEDGSLNTVPSCIYVLETHLRHRRVADVHRPAHDPASRPGITWCRPWSPRHIDWCCPVRDTSRRQPHVVRAQGDAHRIASPEYDRRGRACS